MNSLKSLAHLLRPVVRDDPRLGAGEALPRPLPDLLDVRLGHRLADLPVDDVAAAAVEQAAQVVERPGYVDVRDIDVPVFVGLEGLGEANALLGGLGVVALQQSGGLEDAVDAGRATGDDVGIEHHEGQAAIALQGVQGMEVDDGPLLGVLQPVVAGDPGVVLVGLAGAVFPCVPLGGGQAEPQEEQRTAMPVLSDQRWTKSTIWSRVS
jgi:hypothetical protein